MPAELTTGALPGTRDRYGRSKPRWNVTTSPSGFVSQQSASSILPHVIQMRLHARGKGRYFVNDVRQRRGVALRKVASAARKYLRNAVEFVLNGSSERGERPTRKCGGRRLDGPWWEY